MCLFWRMWIRHPSWMSVLSSRCCCCSEHWICMSLWWQTEQTVVASDGPSLGIWEATGKGGKSILGWKEFESLQGRERESLSSMDRTISLSSHITLLFLLAEGTESKYSCFSSKLHISWLGDNVFNNSVTFLFFKILFCLLYDCFKWTVKYFCVSAWFSCLLCLENKWSIMKQCAPVHTSGGNALLLSCVSEKLPVKYLEEE